MQVLPGITSTTRTLTVDSDRARSLAKAGDAAGLDTGRRLQSEARDDRSRMNGDDLDVEIPESHQGRKACTVVGILAAVAAAALTYRLHGVYQHAFLELSIAIALLVGLDLWIKGVLSLLKRRSHELSPGAKAWLETPWPTDHPLTASSGGPGIGARMAPPRSRNAWR